MSSLKMLQNPGEFLYVHHLIRGIDGGILGAFVGFVLLQFLFDLSFYSIAIPGALVGVGFDLFTHRCRRRDGLICAALGLVACLVSEWLLIQPFSTFLEFVHDLVQYGCLSNMNLGIGILSAFWFGGGRSVNSLK